MPKMILSDLRGRLTPEEIALITQMLLGAYIGGPQTLAKIHFCFTSDIVGKQKSMGSEGNFFNLVVAVFLIYF